MCPSLSPSVFGLLGCRFSAPHPSWPTCFDLSVFHAQPKSELMARRRKSDPARREHLADSDDNEAGPSRSRPENPDAQDAFSESESNGSESRAQDRSIHSDADEEKEGKGGKGDLDGFGDGMDLEGFSGPKERVVKPLTPEALAMFRAAKEKTGVIYISRIPPGMRPTKVRHLMSQYGEVGKVYLQQEGECAIILF